jgi:hypothetical protein
MKVEWEKIMLVSEWLKKKRKDKQRSIKKNERN